jgi:hypothetical protein
VRSKAIDSLVRRLVLELGSNSHGTQRSILRTLGTPFSLLFAILDGIDTLAAAVLALGLLGVFVTVPIYRGIAFLASGAPWWAWGGAALWAALLVVFCLHLFQRRITWLDATFYGLSLLGFALVLVLSIGRSG